MQTPPRLLFEGWSERIKLSPEISKSSSLEVVLKLRYVSDKQIMLKGVLRYYLDDTDSDIITFFSDGTTFVTIGLNNIYLDDIIILTKVIQLNCSY